MKIFGTCTALTVFILALSFTSLSKAASEPMLPYLSDAQFLKVKRLDAKNMQNVDLDSYVDLDDARDEAFDENNSDCGNIEIGNIQGGQIGAPPPQVDIIITKDIILAGSDC